MTTTCQEIYARAKRFNIANNELAPTKHEFLSRINADQHALFASIAAITRDRFQTTAAINSNNASSAREIDFSATTPSVQRILKVVITSSAAEITQVDVLDTDAEFAPRYFVRGQKLIEVGSDWGASGVVGVTLTYVYGATAIDATGASSQLITVPDEWADLLVMPLALYFYQQSPATGARAEAEFQRLTAMLEERQKAFYEYVKNYGGVEARRFMMPQTTDIQKK